MSIKRLLKNKYFLLFLILLVLMVILFLLTGNKAKGNIVRISHNNQTIAELPLSESYESTFEFEDEYNEVVIKDNKVKVISANCENQVCVDTGEISEVGEIIACLPHKFIVEVIEN